MIPILQDLFIWVLASSIMGSLLVVVIFTVKFIIKNRLDPNWHYLIWFFLLIRLLIPILPSTPLSIYNFIPVDLVRTGLPTGIDNFWLEKSGNGNSLLPNEQNIMVKPLSETPEVNLLFLSSWLWLVVIVILVVRFITIEVKFRYDLKKVHKINDIRLLNIFEACKRKLKISNIDIWETDSVQSPVLYGLARPRLLMPVNFADKLNSKQLTHIFMHELCHLKRKDIAINWLVTFLIILHWFNPLLWYAFNRMEEDQELACDALVLNHLQEPEAAKDYAQTIIRVLEIMSHPPGLSSTVGISTNQSLNKKRIAMITFYKQASSSKRKILGLIIAFAISIVSLTNAVEIPEILATTPQKPLKVLERKEVLSNPTIVAATNPDDAVYGYVTARFTRSTSHMQSIMTKNLADKTGISKFPGSSFGQSSPWVERAEITGRQVLGNESFRYQVKFWFASSAGITGTQSEIVEVQKINGKYLISHVEEK